VAGSRRRMSRRTGASIFEFKYRTCSPMGNATGAQARVN